MKLKNWVDKKQANYYIWPIIVTSKNSPDIWHKMVNEISKFFWFSGIFKFSHLNREQQLYYMSSNHLYNNSVTEKHSSFI